MRTAVKANSVRTERRALSGGVIALDLPFPPSLNNLYPTRSGGGRGKSEEYEAWIHAAGWELKRQRPSCAIGSVEITITLQEQTKRMDIDNRIKALLDLLVSHGIIESDHNGIVRKVTAQWGDVLGAHVEIASAPTWTPRRRAG